MKYKYADKFADFQDSVDELLLAYKEMLLANPLTEDHREEVLKKKVDVSRKYNDVLTELQQLKKRFEYCPY